MTLEVYLERMHDLHLRDHLERPMACWNTASVHSVSEPMFLEGLEPAKWEPGPAEDFSHMNSLAWRRLQAAGRHKKPGNKRKPPPA